ncbi:MAG TPA: ECF-type sigma factor [Terracidiphilus sp.]|nr:ECF-type sigma factor [Terracidiphilus sp.]
MTNGLSGGAASLAPDAEALSVRLSAQPRIPSVSSDEYRTLLRMARALHWRCRSWTLSPTALVHEVLLKVYAWPGLPMPGDPHFMALAARAMRQVLVDAARRKLEIKNGGGLKMVPLTERMRSTNLSPIEFLDLNRALDELAGMNPRHALAIEYTSYYGYTIEETAAMLKISAKTVQRDLRAANAWLASRVNTGSGQ